MGFDLAGMLRQADEYVRRHLKSKAVREAEKRRAERQSREAGRRIRRAALVGGASGAGILGYGIVVAPLAGPALIVAGGSGALLAAAALAWPSRRRAARGGRGSRRLPAVRRRPRRPAPALRAA